MNPLHTRSLNGGRVLAGLLAVLLAGCDGGTSRVAAEAAPSSTADSGTPAHAGEADEGSVLLTPAQVAASGIETVAVGRGGGGSLRLSGRVEPAAGARAAVSATLTGRVEQVLVAPGSAVRRGQPLAVVVSGEAAVLRANAVAAAAEAQAARLAHRRDQALVDQGVVARQDLEATHARAQAAQAQAAAAQAQAVANGSPDQQGRLRITSPVDGVVGSVQVTPGAVVAAGSPVADIADPSRNELVFTAPPAVAAKVAPGMALEVSGPTGSFGARVIGSAADVRQPGGAAIIRATADAALLPAAGSALSAVVVVDTTPGTLDVPSDAVQNVDGSTAVFVAIDGGFRAQPVLTGRRAGDRIEVLSGLQGNERVAGANAFLLKAELAKGDAEHGH